MKIAIIGYSGAGKSTLAQRLSQALDIPVLHLDTVHWLPDWQERDKESSLRIVGDFLDENSPKGWVVDGNYSDLLHNRRMAEADRIIFLDYPALHCFIRAFNRYMKNRGKNRPSMAAGCNEKFDFEFVRWLLVDGRNRKRRAAFERLETEYPGKFIRCKKDKHVKKAVAAICGVYE